MATHPVDLEHFYKTALHVLQKEKLAEYEANNEAFKTTGNFWLESGIMKRRNFM